MEIRSFCTGEQHDRYFFNPLWTRMYIGQFASCASLFEMQSRLIALFCLKIRAVLFYNAWKLHWN